MSNASIRTRKSPAQLPSQPALAKGPPKPAVKTDVTMPFGTVSATSSNNVNGKTTSSTPFNSRTAISKPSMSTASTPRPTSVTKADIEKLFQNPSSSSSSLPHPHPSPLGVHSYATFTPSICPPQQGGTPLTNMPNQSRPGAGPPPIPASPRMSPHPHQSPPMGASQVPMQWGGYYYPVPPRSASPSIPGKHTMAHAVPHPPHVPQLPSSIPSPPPPPSTTNALRLNTNANAFVPGWRPSTKIVIGGPGGLEVTLDALKKNSSQPPIVAIPSASPIVTSRQTTSIRIENEGVKRLREDSLRKGQEKKKCKDEEEAERKRTAEEEERERIRRGEEEAAKKEWLSRDKEKRLEAQRKEEEEKQEQKDALEAEEAQLEADEADDIVETTSPVSGPQCSEDGEVLDTDELPKPQLNGCSGKKVKETSRIVTFSVPPLSEIPRRGSGPVDLTSAKRDVSALPPSALLTARVIENLSEVKYPEGIRSPHVELNANSKDGRFRYDRDFLLQFMHICKEKPPVLTRLDVLGIEPVDQASFSMTHDGSERHRNSSHALPPSALRQPSVGLGLGGFPKPPTPSSFQINFQSSKLTSDERFALSSGPTCTSVGSGVMQITRSPMMGSPSQGGPDNPVGSKRTRAKRGEKSRASRKATVSFQGQSEVDSSEIVEREVKALLDELTIERFDLISDQIVHWMNNNKDTLAQVVRLVLEKAVDETAWSEMYARLCRKVMEQLSPDVQDDEIKNQEGKPIVGGQLFRKYLLNRCQEDFERGWFAKEATAAAAAAKPPDDQATKAANEKKETGEVELYSDEYYAAQKAKRKGLGLIKFVGELFKLQMLSARIMHKYMKELLGNVENPEEERIESSCQLLKTVGQLLDTQKARAHMDVYFTRMKELGKSTSVSSRIQFMLQDVIELRERKWVSRNVAAPMTIAAVHEAACRDRLAAEKESFNRQASISRSGGECNQEFSPDGWAIADASVSRPLPNPKAGDLSQFGKISKGAPMVMGPSGVFAVGKKDARSNMFHMLSHNPELTPEASTKHGLPTSGKLSLNCGETETNLNMWKTFDQNPEALMPRKKLDLLPRFKPSVVETQASIWRRMDKHVETFFTLRDPEKAGVYFTSLPQDIRFNFVIKLVAYALKTDEADARLVSNFFVQAASTGQCTPDAFEKGFMPMAGRLDKYAINFSQAYYKMAMMLKGAGFENEPERLKRIVSKLEDSNKLVSHLSLRSFQ